MFPRLIVTLGVLAVIAGLAPAQVSLQLPAGPAKPGVPFKVVLTNNTSQCIDPARSNNLTLLQSGGELISPVLVGCGPVSMCLSNGAKTTLTYTAPVAGPGSSGSFVLLCPHSTGAAVRLDVGTTASLFPDIHAFPLRIAYGPGGHQAPLPPGGGVWAFANTASTARVIATTLRLIRPNGVVVAQAPYPALSIPAHGVARVPIPTPASVQPGPYTVETSWFDPGTKRAVTSRHGVVYSSGTSLDLHFPGGRTLLRGAPITAEIVVSRSYPRASTPWPYVVAIGYQPGSTRLSASAILPLAMDPLVVASVVNGVGGLLRANVSSSGFSSVYCAHAVTYYPTATGIRFTHPGPLLGGVRLRVAAIAIDPATKAIVASQPEEITLQ